jgi:hypothetical protein
MVRVVLFVALAAFCAVVSGQAQKGRILEAPVPALCAQSKVYLFTFQFSFYYKSIFSDRKNSRKVWRQRILLLVEGREHQDPGEGLARRKKLLPPEVHGPCQPRHQGQERLHQIQNCQR